MIKITKVDIQKGRHNPNHELSERLAPLGAILLLVAIILTFFI